MNKEKLQKIAYLTVALAGVLLIGGIFFRFLFLPLLPFLIAWGAAFALRPLASKISERTHINKKAVSVALAIITVSIGLFALISIVVLLLDGAWRLVSGFLSDNRIGDILSAVIEPLSGIFGDGEGEIAGYIEESVKGALSRLLDGIISLLTGIVKGIPGVVFFILVTVISAIYFCLDLDGVNSLVKRLLPPPWMSILRRIKDGTLSAGMKYIRSYLFLMLITFSTMLLGFLLIRVEGAFAIAAVTALLDVLPLIGVGTVLLPWGVISLVLGYTGRAIGLFVLFGVHEVIRQLVEPRIVGKSLGLHPIASLILLYVGYKIFGFAGLLLTPLVSVAVGILREKNDPSEID